MRGSTRTITTRTSRPTKVQLQMSALRASGGACSDACWPRARALPWPGPGRLLDFGCGAGSFLKTMADRGWQVTGLDAASGAVDQVRSKYGLPALVGTLPHPDLRPGSFDVVTMWHSLEHVHHPLALLRAAYDLLVPGGKVVVATPNIEGLPFRLFGHSWFGLDLPRHHTHFTPETLSLMLQTAGFRTQPVRFLRHNDLALPQLHGRGAARRPRWPLSRGC